MLIHKLKLVKKRNFLNLHSIYICSKLMNVLKNISSLHYKNLPKSEFILSKKKKCL